MQKTKNLNLPNGLWLDEETDKICMERCPKCGRENYCMNVLLGICTWCGYDANKEYKSNSQKTMDKSNTEKNE